jgi:hypothetical protein
MKIKHKMKAALLMSATFAGATALAALPVPTPTPAQQEAAAAKKAAADAQAAKDKASLAASMDAVSTRWRGRAAQQGWKTHAPVAIAAAAPAAPAAAVPAAGAPAAAAGAGAAPSSGRIVTTAGAGGQQAGQLPASPANPIVKSEKFGTAPPSEDQKAGPTRAEPRSASPTVQKGSPEGVSKK